MALELMLLTVIPAPGVKLIVLTMFRFEPLMESVTLLPGAAEEGARAVIIGAPGNGLTIKAKVLDVPPGVVTETVRGPDAAIALMLTVATASEEDEPMPLTAMALILAAPLVAMKSMFNCPSRTVTSKLRS